MVHYLTFEGLTRGASEESSRSMNADTIREKAPGCELRGVSDAILERVLGLSAMSGVGARILIQIDIVFVNSTYSSTGGGTQGGADGVGAIETVVESPTTRTGRLMAEEPIRCDITSAEFEGPEGRIQLVLFCR